VTVAFSRHWPADRAQRNLTPPALLPTGVDSETARDDACIRMCSCVLTVASYRAESRYSAVSSPLLPLSSPLCRNIDNRSESSVTALASSRCHADGTKLRVS